MCVHSSAISESPKVRMNPVCCKKPMVLTVEDGSIFVKTAVEREMLL